MSASANNSARANYGLDAPGLVRLFFFGGGLMVLIGAALIALRKNALLVGVGFTLLFPGIVFFLESLLMFFSSHYGKLRARDKLLDNLRLRGDETVLDVGCGRGLLLIGAAKRLPNGKAMGLDLWSQKDLADNRSTATTENARIEDVDQRVEVHNGDMREMPFGDGTFDAIVASNSIHNIYDRDGRRKAINQIVRVLKSGGQVALLDIRHTAEYAEDLRAAGIQGVERSGLIFWIFPPVRVVTGKKP
ncbi:MAG TPA: class I SAM-dependent methyltransferase [Tepidisphaeraceae bacterium]|jgi:SAM-dependent methyltransferase|nr:class I SAM-dependent methyltransferase [Tepidisphaeraceae bacterium]